MLPKKVPSSAGTCCNHCSSGDKSHHVKSCGNGYSRALKSPTHILLPHSPAFFQGISWSRKPLPSKSPFSSQPTLTLLFSPKEVLPSCLFRHPQLLGRKEFGAVAWVVAAHCSRCQACVCCDHRLLILSSRKRCTSISWAGRAMPPLVELGQTSPCSVTTGVLSATAS